MVKNRLIPTHKIEKGTSHSAGEIMLSSKMKSKNIGGNGSTSHVSLSFSQDNLPFSGAPPVRPAIEITAFTGRRSPRQWRESNVSSSTSTLQTSNHFNPICNSQITKKLPSDYKVASFPSKKLRTPPINGIIPSIKIQNFQSFSSTELG